MASRPRNCRTAADDRRCAPYRGVHRRRASARNPAFPISAVPAASGRRCGRSISPSSLPRRRRGAKPGGGASRWIRRCAQAEPNRGHRAVAALVNRGKASAVITQNIDGLHQASGVPADRVIELHGNTTYAHCLDCAQRYEIEDMRVDFERTGDAPRCDACGGFVKTATVSFGQSMPRGGDDPRRGGDAGVAICSSRSVRRWWCIRRRGFPSWPRAMARAW